MPGRATNIRPGLICGPLDPTDRFTYWPVRVGRGGEVLAPGDGTDPVQIIDVRDLAEFSIECVEDRTVGTFNAVGPGSPMTMRAVLDACRDAASSSATFTWIPTGFLEAENVSPWSDLPAWVPGTGESAGFARVSSARAVAKGLRFRPVKDTASATLAWWSTLPEERRAKLQAGLSPEREAAVLAKWKASRG
jgi:2'-hydroxyisoflavone reductase